MLGSRLICALAAIVLAASVVNAVPILNGGIGCKPLTIRQVTQAMLSATTQPSVAEINTMIDLLRTYEFHICTACKAPYTQAITLANLGAIPAANNGVAQTWQNYVVCQCAPGYGFYQWTTNVVGKGGKSTVYYKTNYGCTKCPAGFTSTIVNQQGPRQGQKVTVAPQVVLPNGGTKDSSTQTTILPFTFNANGQSRCVAVGK